MNSVKLQNKKLICRNLWYFYILIINYQEEGIKKKILYTIALKRVRYLKTNLTKGSERTVPWKI